MHDSFGAWCWWLILVLLLLLIVRLRRRFARLSQLVDHEQVRAIGGLETGFAIVEGKVVALAKLLKAPLTGELCVAWDVTVAVRGEDADIRRRSGSIPFKLDDSTGGIEPGPGFAWWGQTTLHLEFGDAPTTDLLECVRRLLPTIEGQCAGGDLAGSGMACHEAVLREGDSICMAGHVVVDHGNGRSQFISPRGEHGAIAAPTRAELSRKLRASARSYWIPAGVITAIAAIGHVFKAYNHFAVWIFVVFALIYASWFLRNRGSV